MVERQIGDTKDVDLKLHNLENESLLLPCKISSPISFFFPLFSFPFGGSVLKSRSSLPLSLSIYIGFFFFFLKQHTRFFYISLTDGATHNEHLLSLFVPTMRRIFQHIA